jgi:DHA2 family multidrug resistance protein
MELAVEAPDPEARSVVEHGWRRLVIVIAVMLAALLETLDSTIVNVALPTIEGNLGASIDEGIWIVTGYIVANVVAIPLNPVLTRMLGRRLYFTLCIAGFTVASALCSTAGSLDMLVAFRVLQGAFGGGLIATSQVVMRETFPPQAVGVSSALFSIALIVGPALGPLAGGFLTDNVSWQSIFFVNVLPGSIAATVVWTLLRDPRAPQRVTIDWLGLGLLVLWLGALQYALDNGERLDWFSSSSIALAATFAVGGFAAFAWWQWSGTPTPIVDLHVLSFRSVGVGALLALSFGTIIFAPAIVTPLYSSTILHYTAWDSGVLLVMRALPVIVLTPLFATLAQRGADVRYMLGTGFAATALALWWLNGAMTAGSPFWAIAWPLVLSGVGQSMLLVPLIIGVLTTTPPALNGKISPLITLCVQLGGSLGSAGSITFFDRRTSFHESVLAGAANAAHLARVGLQPTVAMLERLGNLVTQQATTLGFADTVLAVGALAAVVGPLVLFFPRSQRMA